MMFFFLQCFDLFPSLPAGEGQRGGQYATRQWRIGPEAFAALFLRSAFVLAIGFLLSGCAVREPRPGGAWLVEREAWFAAHPSWSVNGRLALSDGERGGSLSMRWRADGARHDVMLSSGLGGKRWRLSMTPTGSRLEGSDIDVLIGPDPDALIERAVGWPVPVVFLVDWLRGIPGPAAGSAQYAGDGTLARLRWQGWEIEYDRWRQPETGVLLPSRVTAVRDSSSVRAVLSGWQFDDEQSPRS